MSDDTASPTRFEIELRETLDRLGDLSLKLNDRVEEQTNAISHATTMTNEARRAAEAAKLQTDPDLYADYAIEVIDKRLESRLQDIKQTAGDLFRASSYTREVLDKANLDRSNAQRQLWEREHKLDQFKSRLRWLIPGAVVLVVVLTLLLSRFLADFDVGCAVLGRTGSACTSAAS